MAYAFNAELLCDTCGRAACERQAAAGVKDDGDSNTFPQLDTSSGEADTPQHCGDCGAFLENPLTTEGREYVRHTLRAGFGSAEVRELWSGFYGITAGDEEE